MMEFSASFCVSVERFLIKVDAYFIKFANKANDENNSDKYRSYPTWRKCMTG